MYGHLPLILGMIAVAVGIEQFILHPGDDLPEAARWALTGGITLVLAGTAAVISGTAGNWRAAWPWPIVAIPAAVVIGIVPGLAPAVALGLSAAVLVAIVLAGIRKQRQGRLATIET